MIRSLDVHPLGIYARSREKLDGWVDFHRWERERRGQPPPPTREWSEFAVRTSVPIVGGLAFSADRIEDARWYASSGVEATSLSAVERFLPKGGTFVDVGANIGVFSVAAAKRVGDQGRVVAFEPTPRNRAILEHNLERHGVAHLVEIRPEALGAEAAERILRVYENGLVSGFGEAPTSSWPGRLVDETPVQVIALSEAVAGPVDMIKIDVEGFETEVLHGAAALIERNPDILLLVEFNPPVLSAAGKHPAELLDALPASRWDLWLVDETHASGTTDRLVRFDRGAWTSASEWDPTWYANLLATPTSTP